jgi:hypothetical protein
MFKGVTPATLGLIVMTFLIAGIFAMWTSGITSTQRKIVQKCVYSGAIIERGYYKESSSEIIITIHNYGEIDLAFRPTIKYYRGTTEKRKDIFMYVPALDIKTFSIPNVTKDIQEVRVESIPCEEPCFQCPGADAVLLDYEIRKIK